MRTATLLFFALHLAFGLAAQHPLVGTWEMISGRGISAEGKKFSIDTTTRREIKVITPTHYMLIAQDVQGDSLVFNRSYAGEFKLVGNQYHETPLLASLQIFKDVKTDFTWKLEGDIFTQSGSITRPDGKKVILEALEFRRVKPAVEIANSLVVGTWSPRTQITAGTEGKNDSARLQLITPTHWMQISTVNGKFEYAAGGTYTLHGNVMSMKTDYSSLQTPGKVNLKQTINDGKLIAEGSYTKPDGVATTWNEVFEKVRK
jgi:hypothetical protein